MFGKGVLAKTGEIARAYGTAACIFSGCSGRDQERLVEILARYGLRSTVVPVCAEPTVASVMDGRQAALAAGCNVIIGFGGGSALDTAKAVAAMLTNTGDIMDYLEVVGKGQPLQAAPAPWIGVPTTAGTGSEVTRNAVLSTPQNIKVSLRSPLMLAASAVIDPELTYSLPPEQTAATGMDALAQVIEPYVSRRANAMTDLFCREGIHRGSRALLRAYQNGLDETAREDMCFTSLMGGLALANAGLGAVHGFAGPIGGRFHVPHGAICAALLPAVVQINTRVLSASMPDHPALARYAEIARMVTGSPQATIRDLAHWLDGMRAELHIPRLRSYGIQPEHFEELAELSAAASSMKANPIQISRSELIEVLELAW